MGTLCWFIVGIKDINALREYEGLKINLNLVSQTFINMVHTLVWVAYTRYEVC